MATKNWKYTQLKNGTLISSQTTPVPDKFVMFAMSENGKAIVTEYNDKDVVRFSTDFGGFTQFTVEAFEGLDVTMIDDVIYVIGEKFNMPELEDIEAEPIVKGRTLL